MADFDAVIVGSGINSLVCGALLAKGGWRVCLLERNDYFGGAIKTEQLKQPGFLHERYGAWYPLFTGGLAYQALKGDLDARGVTFLNAPLATATLYPDGESGFLGTSLPANIAELERLHPGDGAAYQRFIEELSPNLGPLFEALGAPLWSHGPLLLAKAEERLGRDGLLALSGQMLGSARDWLQDTFQSPKTQGLLAPWLGHAGLSPESTLSSMMAQVFAATIQFVGMPMPQGGGIRVVEALLAMIRERGGECHTGAEVAEVLVEAGRAVGVRLASGERISASQAVVCNVAPPQLYQRLLAPEHVPANLLTASRRFRPGPACMHINLALKEAPRWEGDSRLAQTPIVNITSGLDGVSKAWNEGIRGLLPAEATIDVGQPCVVDPARAPAGGAVLMIQMLGLPNHPVGDAAGTIKVREGEGWSPNIAERYADRVIKELSHRIKNLQSALVDVAVLSPADLERGNVNLIAGDPYGGSLELAQHYLWRPMPGRTGHATHLPGLYQIGASTFPGHGLGGGSGYLVAQTLLA